MIRTARLVAGISAAAFAVGAGAFSTAGPANAKATVGYEDCASGAFCLFGGLNGRDDVFQDSNPTYGEDNRETLIRHGVNDWAESIANHTGAYFCIYSDWRYQGHWLRIPPGRESNLNIWSPAGHNWANKTSSYKMVGKTENC